METGPMALQQLPGRLCLLIMFMLSCATLAQSTDGDQPESPAAHESETPDKLTDQNTPIQVEQAIPDAAISKRILQILETSGWFESPRVEVQQGIALLYGVAQTPEQRDWAGQIARRTEQVVAVVNR